MFLFLNPLTILILAAIIPPIFLVRRIYMLDKLEKEPPRLLVSLVLLGAASTALAGAGEALGMYLLAKFVPADTFIYNVLLYFVVVGLAEEGFKYMMLKLRTWKNPEFDCQFDGVVYAVCVSMGFALAENIGYVFGFGLSAAVTRALTAIPGHASFGVFMGAWYGLARYYANNGWNRGAKLFRLLSVIVPMLLHGTYDFIASTSSKDYIFVFVVFIVIMFLAAFRMARKLASKDRYI